MSARGDHNGSVGELVVGEGEGEGGSKDVSLEREVGDVDRGGIWQLPQPYCSDSTRTVASLLMTMNICEMLSCIPVSSLTR